MLQSLIMRIAMYTDVFYPYPGGVSTAVVALSQALAQAGHHVFIQTPQPKRTADYSFLHPNITLNFVRAIDVKIYPDWRLAPALPLFLGKIKEFNPDIIHVHTPLSMGIEGMIVGKRLRVPLVHTFHTYFMDEDLMKMFRISNPTLTTFLRESGWRLMRMFGRVTDVTTAPSQYVLSHLLQEQVPGEVVYCPNILPDDHFAPPKLRDTPPRRLLFSGRLSPEKRVDLLLESVALARQKVPDLQFTIIGDGPERHALFDRALELGISSSMQWYGQVRHDQLIQNRLYQQGELFITASRFETFGYTTLEAMAHGLPVIALASRATSEVVAETGFLVSDTEDRDEAVQLLAEAIVKATKKPIADQAQAAFEQAHHYRSSQALPTYIEAYRLAREHHAQRGWENQDSEEIELQE